jgi:hypothetical protein
MPTPRKRPPNPLPDVVPLCRTIPETAAILRISVRAVWYALADGRLRGIPNPTRVTQDSIDREFERLVEEGLPSPRRSIAKIAESRRANADAENERPKKRNQRGRIAPASAENSQPVADIETPTRTTVPIPRTQIGTMTAHRGVAPDPEADRDIPVAPTSSKRSPAPQPTAPIESPFGPPKVTKR